MNQLTTIASLPSGGGCKSAMTAEAGKPALKPVTLKLSVSVETEAAQAYSDQLVARVMAGEISINAAYQLMGEWTAANLVAKVASDTGIYAFEEGGLVRIGDVVPTPADKHGFEPFDYCERS